MQNNDYISYVTKQGEMQRTIKRDELVEMIYSDNDSISEEVMERLKNRFRRWPEEDFMDMINKKSIFEVVRLRKNLYYLR